VNLNELLETYHEDVATLRRELIGYELLRRENDVYWKRETSDPGVAGASPGDTLEPIR